MSTSDPDAPEDDLGEIAACLACCIKKLDRAGLTVAANYADYARALVARAQLFQQNSRP